MPGGSGERRPNILLFVADGLQGAALREGSGVIAPNARALAARGVHVLNAYTPLPTCSPARASLFTGMLPHNHGVIQVEHGVDQDQAVLRGHCPHWAQLLQAQGGYHTGLYGKWHVERSGELHDFGWTEYASLGARDHAATSQQGTSTYESLDPALTRYHTRPAGYNDQIHFAVTDIPPSERGVSAPVDHALEFLRARRRQATDAATAAAAPPWCCVASFYEPNEAMIVGREAYDLYDEDAIELPISLRGDDLSDKPNIYRREAQIFSGLSDAEWRRARACYYGRIPSV